MEAFCYPKSFALHLGGKSEYPQEQRKLCDRGRRTRPTMRQREG
ncbi:addiction module toxin RelE [Lelliottia amnigena]|nr:addiction module toxin RelE [Lelliottia amnigena]